MTPEEFFEVGREDGQIKPEWADILNGFNLIAHPDFGFSFSALKAAFYYLNELSSPTIPQSALLNFLKSLLATLEPENPQTRLHPDPEKFQYTMVFLNTYGGQYTLSTKTFNLLIKSGLIPGLKKGDFCIRADHLARLTEEGLSKIKNIGPGTINEIRQVLQQIEADIETQQAG